VDKSVTVKIALANGLVTEVQKHASEAKDFAERIVSDGYLDPVTGHFHPPQAILRIDVAPPGQFSEGWFSEN
jgi:hypothetical protein